MDRPFPDSLPVSLTRAIQEYMIVLYRNIHPIQEYNCYTGIHDRLHCCVALYLSVFLWISLYFSELLYLYFSVYIALKTKNVLYSMFSSLLFVFCCQQKAFFINVPCLNEGKHGKMLNIIMSKKRKCNMCYQTLSPVKRVLILHFQCEDHNRLILSSST